SEGAVIERVLSNPSLLEKLSAVPPEAWSELREGASERTARRVAAYYTAKMGWNAVTVGVGAFAAPRMLDNGSDVVVHVVLPHMPVPDDATPWERIIDFRADAESRVKYNRLRAWTHEAAKSGKSVS